MDVSVNEKVVVKCGTLELNLDGKCIGSVLIDGNPVRQVTRLVLVIEPGQPPTATITQNLVKKVDKTSRNAGTENDTLNILREARDGGMYGLSSDCFTGEVRGDWSTPCQ